MTYPTILEVETADRIQLCRWWRFLQSPGTEAIGRKNFQVVLDRQVEIMDRIAERMKDVGGFTPEISKKLGWS